MQNEWGTILAPLSSKKAGRKTNHDFDKEIRSDVPGYKLAFTQPSGTDANMAAICNVCDFETSDCLFGLGSYLGGTRFLQEMSTSAYDLKDALSIPKYVELATDRCIDQTVVLPYWVDCKAYSAEERLEYESTCLRALHKLLAVSLLSGKPKKCLLVEYILGGNGAELSKVFLERLGILLKAYNVWVIADEVLTAGRTGKDMTMTQGMPRAFQERVKYITVGKFIKCAAVLEQIPRKPVAMGEALRGTSTKQDVSTAVFYWKDVRQRQRDGVIERRNIQVKKRFGFTDSNKEMHWGKGLLLFSTYTRQPINVGLKNRMLPMIDDKAKIVKMRCNKSKWTRSALTKVLTEEGKSWLAAKEDRYLTDLNLPFLAATVDYVLSGICPIGEAGNFQFRPDHIYKFLSPQKSEEMAANIRLEQKKAGKKCNMSTLSFISGAIYHAVSSSKEVDENISCRAIYKKRKGRSRTEFAFVRTNLFGTLNEKNMELTFWS